MPTYLGKLRGGLELNPKGLMSIQMTAPSVDLDDDEDKIYREILDYQAKNPKASGITYRVPPNWDKNKAGDFVKKLADLGFPGGSVCEVK